MNNFKWCEPNIEIKDVRTGIDAVIRSSYYNIRTSPGEDCCMRWVCQCRHDRGSHDYSGSCSRCPCKKFEYLNNNNCDIECSIQRKIYEVV